MNKKLSTTAILLLALTLFSCQRNVKLHAVLELSGSNRPELEKVINHYSQHKKDSLKLRAAIFLIENMPYYYSYSDSRLDTMKQVQAQIRTIGYINDNDLKKWSAYNYRTFNKVYDMHIITADYLIENIDIAFEQWANLPWNKSLSFSDFCELLLPYRIADEPLERWRKQYYNAFRHCIDSVDNKHNMLALANKLSEALYKNNFRYNEQMDMPHFGASYLLKYSLGVCSDACDLATYTFRAFGIPCGIDYYEYAPDYRGSHQWSFVRDTSGQDIPFWMDAISINIDKKIDRKTAKVFRICYGMQPEIYKGITNNKDIPAIFRNRRVKDVTEKYYGANSITLELSTSTNQEYAYLGVFSSQGYYPVAISKVRNSKATFNNLEPNVIYQPLYINNGKQALATYPFLYNGNKTRYFIPDTLNHDSSTLTRKYKLRNMMNHYLHESTGSTIEFSNNRQFNNPIRVSEIPDTIPTNRITLIPRNKQKEYRYMRITSPEGKFMVIGELQIYANNKQKVNFDIIPKNKERFDAHIKKIKDGSILTYYQSLTKQSEYIDIDFGKAINVDSIIYIPRNDDNFVWKGDEYELFYNNGKQFISLGQKIAKDYSVEYTNIPQGALLWLRNITKGQEEQVFYLENNKQRFPDSLH